MATVKITQKRFDKPSRQFVLDVVFVDGKEEYSEELRYGADFSYDAIRTDLKNRVDLLTKGKTGESSISTGDVDISAIPVEAPSAEQLAHVDWVTSYKELKLAVELEALGVTVATPQKLTALRNKVQTNFKREYATLIN